jgi:bla regulator protein blaR1
MIPKCLSELWTAIAPALGNHVWQSTSFAAVAGLLVLTLRKNQARTRYCLWLAASLKFLVPFSLLVGIGSYVGWPHGSAPAAGGIYDAMQQVSQPFSQPATTAIPHANSPIASASASLMQFLPAALVTVWLCGFVALLFVWCVRWRRMSAVVRQAVPLLEGREAQALRRLQSVGGKHRTVEMLVSEESLEPAIFGIVRPVLVWPRGISRRLDDRHVEAIIAHELCHVRRRDNLSAALHMLVKAIFWFHPLVWWLGARMAEERELACDEEVLEMGSDREVYAESILKVCEFCVRSPLACVSGVTGADLKKRIVRIMTENATRKLDFSRKLLLSAAALLAIAVPITFGLANATPGRARSQTQNTTANVAGFAYDVVSVKPWKPSGGGRGGAGGTASGPETPDGFIDGHATLSELVRLAFGTHLFQVQGAPSWYDSAAYEIDAKIDGPQVDALQKLSPPDRILARQHMLQALLADRFKLTFHHETKEVPVYFLVIAKNGPILQEAKPGFVLPDDIKSQSDPELLKAFAGLSTWWNTDDHGKRTLTGVDVPVFQLVDMLTNRTGDDRPILDRTGLTGRYDLTVRWISPDDNDTVPLPPEMSPAERIAERKRLWHLGDPAELAAIEKQLGLKLERGKGPVDYIVIDHVERPSEN